MSGEKLYIWRCECGEIERAESSPPRWRYRDGVINHYHPGEKKHWPGEWVPAEKVEVVPVSDLADLRAGLAKQIAHLNEEIAGRPRKTHVRRATRFLERLMEHPALVAAKEQSDA